MRIKVDKLDADKSAPVPVNLVKLSDVVKMMLLKRLNIVNQLKELRRLVLVIVAI